MRKSLASLAGPFTGHADEPVCVRLEGAFRFRLYARGVVRIVRASFLGYGEVSPELFEAIYNRFAQPKAWLIYDDVIPTLQTLEQAGLKLAVISNWDERLVPLLERLGLATYFDEIVVSASLRAHKPDPRIFTHAAARLQVAPGRIFHVGDSESEDVAGARAAGFSAAVFAAARSRGLPISQASPRSFRCSPGESLTRSGDLICSRENVLTGRP